MSDRPPIDVVVPAYNEEDAIDACLDAVLAQDYPADLIRVVVIDAGSEDGTARVVEKRAERDPRIVLLSGDGRLNAAQAFNKGFEAGEAPLVARIDAHTYPDVDYLSRGADVFASDARLGVVGGEARHIGKTRFGRAVGIARQSRFGVGDSIYTERRDRVEVDTTPACPVFRRAALDDVGGFATTLLVGEDEEVNWRLKHAGWKILLDRSLRIAYEQRSSWSGLFRQFRNYGQSRVRVVAVHPDFLRPRHVVPGAVVVVGGAIAAAGLVSRRARRVKVPLAATYLLSAAVAARSAAREGGEPELWPQVAAAYLAIHGGYGVGLVEGTAHVLAARAGRAEPPVAVSAR